MDKPELKIVSENTDEELTANLDKQEGFMTGQANAFQVSKMAEDQIRATDKSNDFKAAFLIGFLTYFANVYAKLEQEVGSEGQTLN